MAADERLLPWLDRRADTDALVTGSIYAGLAARVRRGDFASETPAHAPDAHLVEVAFHGPSANAPAGHWSWICTTHHVGTVGATVAGIALRIDEHLRGATS